MSSSDESNSDAEDIEMFEADATRDIESGKLVVNNGDGTYRCPFSPGRKKQSFKHRDLLDHAKGVAKGKKGPEKVGTHRALVKYLDAQFADKPKPPQAVRVHKLEQVVPPRKANEGKLLCPWMGILVNIDNHKTRESDGFRLAAGAADIKEKFKEYNPERVDVFHDYKGHQGTALVTFVNDIHGLKDAEDFHRSFAEAGRGRKEWDQHNYRERGLHLYGWQATEQDLKGDLDLLTKHLCKFSDLKSVADMMEEKERINSQLVQNLVESVGRKNDRLEASHEQFVVLKNIVAEVNNMRVKAEDDMRQMEEKHKQVLEELQTKAHRDAEQHHHRLLQHQVTLANKMRVLQQRCEDMEQTEKLMKEKNEAERRQFEKDRQEARRQLEEVSKQAKMHAARQYTQQEKQKMLIEKHENESKKLEMEVQEQKKLLAVKHQLELEGQYVSEILEIERGEVEKCNTSDNDGEAQRQKVADLEEKLADLQSEYESSEALVSNLTVKERAANDELQEARKAALVVLRKYGPLSKLGIKLAGEINKQPWTAACKERYKYDSEGWEMRMATSISNWELLLKDHNFRPLKCVEVRPDVFKHEIIENDEKLVELKKDLGDVVCKTVTDALLELEEHNASGRYPIELAWDFEKDQQIVMKDLLIHLKKKLDDLSKPVKGKGKRVRRT